MPASSFIPREGPFTLDSVVMLLKKTLFNPTLTLPVLLLLQFTEHGQELIKTLGAEYPKLWMRFKYIVALGVIGRVNHFLSWGASNNWKKATFKPSEEIVVVTGGSSGIGAGIVQELVARGGLKAIVVLDLQELRYTAASNVHYYHTDLSSGESISAVAKKIQQEIGHPTVLINNAGICRGRSILDATERDISLTFKVNTVSHFLLAKAFLPDMIKHDRGHIVTVASVGGYFNAPQMVDYNCSKAAALSFHEGLGLELKYRYNAPTVRTSLVTQGFVKTPLFVGYDNRSKFLLPDLEPETVGEAIVDTVWKAQSNHVVLPRMYGLLTGARGWSRWVHRGLLGQTRNSMSQFNGKQVMEEK